MKVAGRAATLTDAPRPRPTPMPDDATPPDTRPVRDDDLPEPLDVIAVGAHPDDVEIACGGTLAMLVRQGHRVGIVDLTDGEPTPLSDGPHVRLAEARRAAEILGVQVRETLPLTNRRLFDGLEERVALAKVFRRYRPQVVLGSRRRPRWPPRTTGRRCRSPTPPSSTAA